MNKLHKICKDSVLNVANRLGITPENRHFFTDKIKTPEVPHTRGYNPDIVLVNHSIFKIAVIEIETQPGPGKLIEDLVCTKLLAEQDNAFKGHFTSALFIATHLKAIEYAKNWIGIVSSIQNVCWPKCIFVPYDPIPSFEADLFSKLQTYFRK